MKILVKTGPVRYIVIQVNEGDKAAAIVDSFNDDRGMRPKALIEANKRERAEDASVRATYDRLAGVIPAMMAPAD